MRIFGYSVLISLLCAVVPASAGDQPAGLAEVLSLEPRGRGDPRVIAHRRAGLGSWLIASLSDETLAPGRRERALLWLAELADPGPQAAALEAYAARAESTASAELALRAARRARLRGQLRESLAGGREPDRLALSELVGLARDRLEEERARGGRRRALNALCLYLEAEAGGVLLDVMSAIEEPVNIRLWSFSRLMSVDPEGLSNRLSKLLDEGRASALFGSFAGLTELRRWSGSSRGHSLIEVEILRLLVRLRGVDPTVASRRLCRLLLGSGQLGWRVVRALASLPPDATRRVLEDQLRRSSLSAERLALTEAIGALQFEAAWPTLRSLALGLDEPLLVRLAAVSALARMDRARGELVLLQAARSGRPQVRGAALAELGAERFAGGAARAALEQALSDPSETVRLVAVEGLAIIGDHRSASALRGCLSASSAVLDEVGARVIRALRCLRDFASAAEIIGLAVKAREPLFVECLRFVRELPSDRAIRALLENSDPAFGARRWQLLELLIPSQIAERPVEQDIEAWRRWWETRDGAPLYRDGRPQWR